MIKSVWKKADRHWRDVPGIGRREVNVHHLKCEARQFEAVVAGKKRAEFREQDRTFYVGDILVLYKLNTSGMVEEYSPRHAIEVIHVVEGGQFGIPVKFCMLSIQTYNGLDASFGRYVPEYPIGTSEDE